MSSKIPTTEPIEIVQGTTVKWTRTISDYPRPLWTATYHFVAADKVTVSGTGSTSIHSFELTKAATQEMNVGEYQWQLTAEYNEERFHIDSGMLTVARDFANTSTGTDIRSHVKRTLDNLEKAIEGTSSTDVLNYTIGDRSIARIPKTELITLYNHYTALYAAEKRRLKAKRGRRTNFQIRAKFRNG